MNRIVPLLILCVLTQGCVGISVQSAKTERFQDPHLADNGSARGLRDRDPGETNATAYTTAWLEAHWGKPSVIRHAGPGGLDETWTYKFDLNCTGALLFVIIPIPLEVPTGREGVQLAIRAGRVISGEQRFTRTVGGIVGYSLGPCGFSGFGVHSLND